MEKLLSYLKVPPQRMPRETEKNHEEPQDSPNKSDSNWIPLNYKSTDHFTSLLGATVVSYSCLHRFGILMSVPTSKFSFRGFLEVSLTFRPVGL